MNSLEISTRRSKMAANKSALLQAKTAQWSTAKLNLNIFSLKEASVSDEDNGVTEVTLFAKNHWFLRVQGDGNVSGTRDQASDEVSLLMFSVGKGLVQIFSPEARRYIAMESTGRLFSSRNKTNSTIFKHVMGENGFHTFSSHKYYRETPHDMFIALQKDGIPRKGNKTCRLHKGSQFLII